MLIHNICHRDTQTHKPATHAVKAKNLPLTETKICQTKQSSEDMPQKVFFSDKKKSKIKKYILKHK